MSNNHTPFDTPDMSTTTTSLEPYESDNRSLNDNTFTSEENYAFNDSSINRSFHSHRRRNRLRKSFNASLLHDDMFALESENNHNILSNERYNNNTSINNKNSNISGNPSHSINREENATSIDEMLQEIEQLEKVNNEKLKESICRESSLCLTDGEFDLSASRNSVSSAGVRLGSVLRRRMARVHRQQKKEEEEQEYKLKQRVRELLPGSSVSENIKIDNYNPLHDSQHEVLLDTTLTSEQNGSVSPPWLSPSKLNTSNLNMSSNSQTSKGNVNQEDIKNVELCFIRQQLELNTEYDAAPSINSSISRNHKEMNVLSHHSSAIPPPTSSSTVVMNESQQHDNVGNNNYNNKANANEPCMREGSVNWANKYMTKKKKAASPEPFSSNTAVSSSASATKAHRDKSVGYIPEVMIFDFHSASSHERESSCAQLSKTDGINMKRNEEEDIKYKEIEKSNVYVADHVSSNKSINTENTNASSTTVQAETLPIDKSNQNNNNKQKESTQLQSNKSTNSDVNQTSSVNDLVNVINTVNKYMKLQERTHTIDSDNSNYHKSKNRMSDNGQGNGTLLNSNAVKKYEQSTLLNTKIIDNHMKRDEESKVTTSIKSQVEAIKNNESIKPITTEHVLYKEKPCNNLNSNSNIGNNTQHDKTRSEVHVDSSLVHTLTPSFTVTDTTSHYRRHTYHEESNNNSCNINDSSDMKEYGNGVGDKNNNSGGKSSDHNEHKKVLVSEKMYSKENLSVQPRHSTHNIVNDENNNVNSVYGNVDVNKGNNNKDNKNEDYKKVKNIAIADNSKVNEHVQSKDEWTSYKDMRQVQTSRLPQSARRKTYLSETLLKQTPPSPSLATGSDAMRLREQQKQVNEQKIESTKAHDELEKERQVEEPRPVTQEAVSIKSTINESEKKTEEVTLAEAETTTVLQNITPLHNNSQQNTSAKSHLPARNVLYTKNLNQAISVAQSSKPIVPSADDNKRKDEQMEKTPKGIEGSVKLEANKTKNDENNQNLIKTEDNDKEAETQGKVKYVKIAESKENIIKKKSDSDGDNKMEPSVVQNTLSTSTRNTEKSKCNEALLSENTRVAASARFLTQMEPSPEKESNSKLRGYHSGYSRRYVADSPSLPRPHTDRAAVDSLLRDKEEISSISSTAHTKKTNILTSSSQHMEDVIPIENNNNTNNNERSCSATRKSASPAPVLNQRLSTSREMPRRMSWSPELAQLKRNAHVKQNTLIAEMTNNKSYHGNTMSNSTTPIIDSLSTLHHENINVDNSVDNDKDKGQMMNSEQADSCKKNADEEVGKSENDKNDITKTTDNTVSNENKEEEVVVVRLSELKSARPTPMTTRLTEKRREEAIRARREREQREAEAAASLSKKAPFDVSRHDTHHNKHQPKQAAEASTENNTRNNNNNDVKRSKEQLLSESALAHHTSSSSGVKPQGKDNNTHIIPIHHAHNHYQTARLSTLSFASVFGNSTRDTTSICSDKFSTSDVPMSSRHPRPRQDKKMTKSTIRLKASLSNNTNSNNNNGINASATARTKATNAALESSREPKKNRTSNIKPTSMNGTNNNNNVAATARVPHTMTLSALKEQDASLMMDAHSPISPLLTTRASKQSEKQSQAANRKNVVNDKSEKAQTLPHTKQTPKEMENKKKNTKLAEKEEELTVEGKMVESATRSQGKASTTENENKHAITNVKIDAKSSMNNNDDKNNSNNSKTNVNNNLNTGRNDGSNKENLSVSNPNVITNSTYRLKSASPEMPSSARGFGFPVDRAPSQPFQYRMAPFCIECGHRHVDDMAKFCAYCGHKRVPV